MNETTAVAAENGNPKRILFCCHYPLDPRLGIPKHYLELAKSFRSLGWQAQVVGPDEIAGGKMPPPTAEHFGPHLRDFIRRAGGNHDVFEYDHEMLPYPSDRFSA